MISLLEWLDTQHFIVKNTYDVETGEFLGVGPMVLFPHHRRILGHCFTPDERGRFPYSTVVISCPKKSGKTTLLAMIGAWAAECAPDGAEIYSIANDLEQAQARAFTDIVYHFEQRGYSSTRNRIDMDNGTFVQAIANQYSSAAGARQFMTLFDELWGYSSEKSRRMWAEMTPPPSVPNSMRVVTTYAGFENESDQLLELYNMCFKREAGVYINGEVVPELADIVDSKDDPVCRRNGRTFIYWDHEPRMPWQSPEYYCLPLPTKKDDLVVLTSSGWKAAADITLSDALCTRALSGQIEYQKPSHIRRDPYSGDLVRLHHTKADLLMTPNHRVYAAYADHTRKVKDILTEPFVYEYREAKDAMKAQVGWIPGHGEWQNEWHITTVPVEDLLFDGDDFAELLAWYLSEGNVQYSNVIKCHATGERKKYPTSIFISQDRDVNADKHQRIMDLCTRMGLAPHSTKVGVRVGNAKLARYMLQFGKSSDKFIPRWFLEGGSESQFLRFFDAYALGDGTRLRQDGWKLYTNSDQMRLDLMELSFKAGLRPRYVGSWSSAPEKGRKPIHHISVMRSHIGWYASGKKRNSWSIISAPEGTEVWCPTLPNGNFYVMQNGCCYWTGNSEQMMTLRPVDFLRMHRNMWVSSNESFIPIELWERAARHLTGPATLFKDDPRRTYPISVGIDIGMKHDCSALVGVYWDSSKRRAGVAFSKIWTPPKDAMLDLEFTVEAELLKLHREFKIVSVVYDPAQFQRSSITLQRKGLPMVEYPNTAGNMMMATQALYDLLKNDTLDAYPDPEMRDHIRYATAETTSRGFRLVKGRNAKFKIDAAIALAMACFDAVNRGGMDTSLPVNIISPFSDATAVRVPTIADEFNMKLPEALRD